MKKCLFCKSESVIKKGKRNGIQRYLCTACNGSFKSKRRKSRLQNKLWNEYTIGKQTADELAKKYNRSRKWIGQQINKVVLPDSEAVRIEPKPIVVIADATFYSWADGLLIFREPNLKKNLIWKEIHTESPAAYAQLKLKLESEGFTIEAAVLDGKRGVREVFRGIPVQMCQFHQVAIVRRYLTSRPKLPASQELLFIARQLTKSNENEFTNLLNEWFDQWSFFLKEKTVDPLTKKWFYTHKSLRAAFRSLKSNLPFLFIYLKYPDLHIPNTCNSLDGYNTTLKNALRIHRGAGKEKRNKIIHQILGK